MCPLTRNQSWPPSAGSPRTAATRWTIARVLSSDGSGEWLCEGKPEGAVCETCIDGEGGERVEWPCEEYRDLLAALTGKGEHGG